MILCKQKNIFLFLFIIFIASNLFGQDAHFSQFYANPLYLNPAFAGSNNCPRFSINFRDQWPSIPGHFITFSGSYDQHINALHGGIGLLFVGDKSGGNILNTYNASAIYNFRIKVTPLFNLQFALQGGYFATSFNSDNLQYVSDICDIPVSDFEKLTYINPKPQFDVAAGFVGYTSFLYFGVAVHHLTSLKKSLLFNTDNRVDVKWRTKITAHLGGKIIIKQLRLSEDNYGDISLYPNIVFITQSNDAVLSSAGAFHYLHEGFYFKVYPFTIGTWLRHNFNKKNPFDAFIVNCGIEYKFLRVGYSYDFNLTKLERTGGAHEVSLQFTIPCNPDRGSAKEKAKKKNQYATIECPKF
jgi:type IX secretion system PorP/SprF family membrane protein